MSYILHILVLSGLYIILTMSLNLVVGYTGMLSIGHIAFAGIGAYTSALLALRFGISPWLGLPIGASFAALLGFVVGYPTIRLKGDYLALGTFGFGLIIYTILKNWIGLTQGPMGLPGISCFTLFNWQISQVWSYLLLVIFFVLLTIFVIHRIVKAPIGRILRAIRDDEIAAQSLGKNTKRHKLMVFMIGSFFAGIAGVLYAHYIRFIDPSSFTVTESITVLLMVIFGGMASVPGSILGAVILVILPEGLRFIGLPSSIAAQIRQMLYGLLLITLVIWRPRGLVGRYRIV